MHALRVPSAAVLALTVAAPLAAQPVRTLSTPQFEYAEPFSQITGLRELRDGRVIVADLRDKTLQAIDLRSGRATAIGREGSGPNEWGMLARLLPFAGDSVLLVDPLNSRFLLIGPDGRPVRTIMPAGGGGPMVMGGPAGAAGAAGAGGRAVVSGQAGGAAGAASGASAGAAGGRAAGAAGGRAAGAAAGQGAAQAAGGRGGPTMSFGGLGPLAARGVDRQGRMYSEGFPVVMTEQGPVTADSVPLLRQAFGATAADTMAWIQLPKNAANVQASGSGGQQTMAIRIGGNTPFVTGDQWAVAPDGRIVIARVKDYHLDVIMPDKRVVRGPAVAYTPVRVTEADKTQWREERRAAPAMAISNNNNNGAVTRSVATAAAVQEPDSWPATKSPFGGNAVSIAPNGQAWVRRQMPASERAPTFDIFDVQGKLTGQIKFPARTSLLGFGAKGVYLARMDDDDLQYIQHHAMTW